MMVSKLKAVPFQSVNSPLLDPVSSRLPSGVHLTTLTGCLILFSDEWSAFAGMVSAGLVTRAAGGSIYKMSVCKCQRHINAKITYINNVAWAWPFLFQS